MTDTPPIRTVAMERDLPWPAEKVWRALTQPHLLAEWLMRTDFAATLGHQFRFVKTGKRILHQQYSALPLLSR